jgi:hypothetical protein
MIRRALFWGLTVVLAGVLVSLIVRSKQQVKSSAVPVTEVVRTAKPSAIRIVTPRDLKIIKSDMRLVAPSGRNGASAEAGATAEHQVLIENRGPVSYINVQLRFTYLGSTDSILESQNYLVDKAILPGQTISAGSIAIDDVPKNARKCTVRILSADFEDQK